MTTERESITAALAGLAPSERLILPALQELQAHLGHVPAEAVSLVAEALGVSQADVIGVLTFYRDLRTTPPPPVRVRLCGAEACQAVGAREVAAALGPPNSWPLGTVEVDTALCLGDCALGPAARVNDRLLSRLSPAALVTAVTEAVLAARPRPDADPEGSGPAPTLPGGSRRAQPVAGDQRLAMTAFVPCDSAARSIGADEVAEALAIEAARQGLNLRLVRTGSRGALWLEPLVEVGTGAGRMGYATACAEDAPALVRAWIAGDIGPGAPVGSTTPVGHVEDLPWFRAQRRQVLHRCGIVDPASLDDYRAHGGLRGLRAALAAGPDAVIEQVLASGLRGRGGAGFPAGVKWRTVRRAEGPVKYLCCNADEGDSGTYADRLVLEGDPFGLLEGMAIAAFAVGATHGYAYVRSEYPEAAAALRGAVAAARAAGLLGPDALGSGIPFDVTVRDGAGSYVCGEETAMLESLEGRRGTVRARPPLPAERGLHGRPTLVHNVLTLAALPGILADGPAAYAELGTGRSRGTQVVQLSGNVARGGAVEVAYGLALRELVDGLGGGTRSGRPVRCVQAGGPLGGYLPAAALDVALDYEAMAAAGGMLGHGGLVVFDDTVDMAEQARFAMAFCAEESCGTCTPCRIGSVRGVELIDRIRAGVAPAADLALLDDLCEVMAGASLCALGGLTPDPVRSALRHFPQDFGLPEGVPPDVSPAPGLGGDR